MGFDDSQHQGSPDISQEDWVDEPRMYRVFLHNDNYTTMEFVVLVLEQIFHKTPAEANAIMLNVHKKGVGECGIYTFDVAQTKVAATRESAKKNQFPLKCTMEEV